jgi:L-asparaginase II
VNEVVVTAVRDGRPESEHRIAWCVWESSRVVAAGGPAHASTYTRSSAKPFQALVAVRSGVLERFGLDSSHLAIACSSHGGSDVHVAKVREVLAALGLDEEALAMGPDDPRDPQAALELRDRGEPRSKVRHNCSGKHALALGACLANGWSLDGYLDADHPLQRAIHVEVARACAVAPEQVGEAIDGCGMRTHHVPLASVAAAFGRLAAGELGPEADRVAAAMGRHPELVGFPGSIDTELMRGTPGVVAKIGAEGMLGIGLPDGRGAAVKVLDGALRALEPAAVTIAGQVLGLPVDAPGLRAAARPDLVNGRGERVGWLEARLA